jgi:hypothetical protein
MKHGTTLLTGGPGPARFDYAIDLGRGSAFAHRLPKSNALRTLPPLGVRHKTSPTSSLARVAQQSGKTGQARGTSISRMMPGGEQPGPSQRATRRGGLLLISPGVGALRPGIKARFEGGRALFLNISGVRSVPAIPRRSLRTPQYATPPNAQYAGGGHANLTSQFWNCSRESKKAANIAKLAEPLTRLLGGRQ